MRGAIELSIHSLFVDNTQLVIIELEEHCIDFYCIIYHVMMLKSQKIIIIRVLHEWATTHTHNDKNNMLKLSSNKDTRCSFLISQNQFVLVL